MRWLALWLVLAAIELAVDLPLRAVAGDPFPPPRIVLLAWVAIPTLQVGALRFVQWMRRSLTPPPEPESEI